MFDWQTTAVILVILAALAYVARRALARLRSFRPSNKKGARPCTTGCGGCDGEAAGERAPAPTPVRISRLSTTRRRDLLK